MNRRAVSILLLFILLVLSIPLSTSAAGEKSSNTARYAYNNPEDYHLKEIQKHLDKIAYAQSCIHNGSPNAATWREVIAQEQAEILRLLEDYLMYASSEKTYCPSVITKRPILCTGCCSTAKRLPPPPFPPSSGFAPHSMPDSIFPMGSGYWI